MEIKEWTEKEILQELLNEYKKVALANEIKLQMIKVMAIADQTGQLAQGIKQLEKMAETDQITIRIARNRLKDLEKLEKK